jgi:hypothetical protein
MGNVTPAIHAATCPRCGVEFGIDNLVLDRTMAGALTGRRAMARDTVPGRAPSK